MTQFIGEEDSNVECPGGESNILLGEGSGDLEVEVEDCKDLEDAEAVEGEEENNGEGEVESDTRCQSSVGTVGVGLC